MDDWFLIACARGAVLFFVGMAVGRGWGVVEACVLKRRVKTLEWERENYYRASESLFHKMGG